MLDTITERNVLTRIDGCDDVPCAPCLWAHEPPAGEPQGGDVNAVTPNRDEENE